MFSFANFIFEGLSIELQIFKRAELSIGKTQSACFASSLSENKLWI